MHYLDGDRAIFEGLAAVLKEESKRQFGEMRAAIARSDAGTVARLAHTIKGLVSTFGARRSVEAARRLEVLSDQGNRRRSASRSHCPRSRSWSCSMPPSPRPLKGLPAVTG